MKPPAVFLAPFLGAIGAFGMVAAVALGFGTGLGCNGAQINTPAITDAGPPCPDLTQYAAGCDAGGSAPALVGACAGGVSVSVEGLDGSSTFEQGEFPQGCVVRFFTDDHAGSCIPSPLCTCDAPDAGTTADGGDAGAAQTAAGVWNCTR